MVVDHRHHPHLLGRGCTPPFPGAHSAPGCGRCPPPLVIRVCLDQNAFCRHMTQQGSIAVFECFFRPSCRMSASSLSSLTESNSYAGPPGERTIPDMATPARTSVQCFHLVDPRTNESPMFSLGAFSSCAPDVFTSLSNPSSFNFFLVRFLLSLRVFFASWCNNISFFVFVLISTREKFFSSFLLQRVQRVCILVRSFCSVFSFSVCDCVVRLIGVFT